MKLQGYFIEKEYFERLRAIEKRLHGGSDAMRDEAHRMWLALDNVNGVVLYASESGTKWRWDLEKGGAK